MFNVFVGVEGAETGTEDDEANCEPVDFVLEWFYKNKVALSEYGRLSILDIVDVEHKHIGVFVYELVGDGIGGVGGFCGDYGNCVDYGVIVEFGDDDITNV